MMVYATIINENFIQKKARNELEPQTNFLNALLNFNSYYNRYNIKNNIMVFICSTIG